MKNLRGWAVRLIGLFRKRHREAEIAQEIESHLELHIADNVRSGMTPEQARREAILTLGGVESAKEAYRAQGTLQFLEHLFLDLRFAVRQFRKSPAFAVTAVLVLALGVASSLAIFAFVDAALLKPLPYPEPSRLFMITETALEFRHANISYPDYADLKRFNTSLSELEVYYGFGFLFQTAAGAEPLPGGAVSGGFFQALGVTPLMGRLFSPNEETRRASQPVILTYSTWQQRFGGSRNVLGQVVRLSGEPYTVVGVLRADFQFAPLGAPGVWTLVDMRNTCIARRSCHSLDGIARPRPGVSATIALADLSAVAKRLEQQYPDSNRDRGVSIFPLSEAITGDVRPILIAVMGGAVLLLLIAGASVTGLVLARFESRQRELAMRSALGASRARLFSQFLTEALVLVCCASTLALFAANLAMQGLKKLIPAEMLQGLPFLADLGLNAHLLIFATALAILAVALFSVSPWLQVAVSEMREKLAEGSRGSSGNAWRNAGTRLVVVELTIAMILLAEAGLLVKSLNRLLHADLGLQPDRLAMITVGGPDLTPGKEQQSIALARGIIRKIEDVPGVQSASITTLPPISFNGNTDWIRIVGKPYDGRHIEINERDVSSEFFQTIGAKLAQGRFFTDADDLSKPNVVIINRTLAKRFFPGEDPIGKQIGDTSLSPKSIHTIVGVIEDIRDGALNEEIWPSEYHPFNQDPNGSFVLIARTAQKAEAVLPALAPTIRHFRPDVGTSGEATMQSRITNSFPAYLQRSVAWLVGAFAVMALFLVTVGLYGVVAYSVSQRTREIGIRMALGAEPGGVYRMVLTEAGRLVFMGIVTGTTAAIAIAVLARKLLFGVSAWDAQTLAGVAILLAVAAIVAVLVPARKAASVSPVEALRAE